MTGPTALLLTAYDDLSALLGSLTEEECEQLTTLLRKTLHAMGDTDIT